MTARNLSTDSVLLTIADYVNDAKPRGDAAREAAMAGMGGAGIEIQNCTRGGLLKPQ
ncbi:MAG: hypothetical protein AAB382_06595 [Chloroflexota bacterium]